MGIRKMIKIERVGDHDLPLPKQETNTSAGFDLSSNSSILLPAGGRTIIDTGFKWEIPVGCAGFIWPRSGIAVKKGIMVMAGLIDSDYRGEIKVCLYNSGLFAFEVNIGDRIAQMVISPVLHVNAFENILDETKRGEGGFGSTGK